MALPDCVLTCVCLQLTCAVSVIPWSQQSTGLLVLSLPLSVMVAVVREGVDALVAARVAVCVVDDHVVRGNGQVNSQLIAGQTSLSLQGRRSYKQIRYIQCPVCQIHLAETNEV